MHKGKAPCLYRCRHSGSSPFPSAAGAAAPMPQLGHECPALVGSAACWQLGGGLVRGQLHHRACHRRVLQHGAARGSGDGRRAGGRRLSPSAAVPGTWTWLSACMWGVLSPGPESTPTPPLRAPSSSSVPLSCSYRRHLGSASSSCHFVLIALLCWLVPTRPGASDPRCPSASLGQLRSVNLPGQLPSSPGISVA